jgi:hypothetical protein
MKRQPLADWKNGLQTFREEINSTKRHTPLVARNSNAKYQMRNIQSLGTTAHSLSTITPIITALILGMLLTSGCSTSHNLKYLPQDPKFSARLNQMTEAEAWTVIRRALEASLADSGFFCQRYDGTHLPPQGSIAARLYQMALNETNCSENSDPLSPVPWGQLRLKEGTNCSGAVYTESSGRVWFVPGRCGNVWLTDTSQMHVARYFFANKFTRYRSLDLVLDDEGRYVYADTAANSKSLKDNSLENKKDSAFVLTLFDKGQSVHCRSIDLAGLADVNRIARFGVTINLFNETHKFVPFIALRPYANERADLLVALYVLCPKLR